MMTKSDAPPHNRFPSLRLIAPNPRLRAAAFVRRAAASGLRAAALRLLIVLIGLLWALVPGPPAGFATGAARAEPAAQAQDPVVVRVYFSGRNELVDLTSHLDVWEVNHSEGFLLAMVRPDLMERLRQAGYRVEIDAFRTAEIHRPVEALPQQSNAIPGFACYRTVEETYSSLAQLAASYPGLIRTVDIGDSWEKVQPGGAPGYDLLALVMTNQAIPGPKPVFFLMAETHAREYATAELAVRFAEFLAARYGKDPDITWLVDSYELHLVAMANPDGRKMAETGVLWRKNTDNDDGCFFSGGWGVDLNRNSSFKWGGVGSSGYACDETYRGPGPDSEPETQAVQDYMRSIFADQRGTADTSAAPASTTGMMVTLHSYGELVLWPWGWTETAAPNAAQLQTLGRKLAYFNQYTAQQAVGLYPTTGSTDDWAYGELGVAAYTIEMGTNFFQDCATFENKVYLDNLQALLYAFKAARRPYQNPGGPDSLNVQVNFSSVRAGTPVVVSATADDTRFNGLEPTHRIAAAQVSLDRPAWDSPAVNLPLAAADGAYDEKVEDLHTLVDTTGWEPGRHTLLVQSRDTTGAWGVPGAAFLWIELDLNPAQAELQAAPGETVAYSLSLTNRNDSPDSYTVETGSGIWTASGPAEIGPLDPGETASFPVYVTVPETAGTKERSSHRIVVTSKSDPQRTAAAMLTTGVRLTGSQFYPGESMGYGQPGARVEQAVTLANNGSNSDIYDLALEGGAWGQQVSSPSVELAAGARTTLTVTIDIPKGATLGSNNQTTLNASSRTSPEGSSAVSLTTHARRNSFSAAPTAAWQTVLPGETVAYTFQVRNTGEHSDSYTVEVQEAAWSTAAQPDSLSLGPGQAAAVTIAVTAPLTAPVSALDTATIKLASQAEPEVALNVVLTTRALSRHQLVVQPERLEATGLPGETITYTVALTNGGSLPTSYSAEIVAGEWEMAGQAYVTPALASLEPGQGTQVRASVTVPANALAGSTHPTQLILRAVEDPTQQVTVLLLTRVGAVHRVWTNTSRMEFNAEPGQRLEFSMQVANAGNQADSFRLQPSAASWQINGPEVTQRLAPGAVERVTFEVTVPEDAEVGTVTIPVKIISEGDELQSVTVEMVIQVARRVFLPLFR